MHFASRWPRNAFLHMCPNVSIFLAFLHVRAHARHPQDCHKMAPRYPKRRILNRAKTRQHMSSIGFDGKLEPAFFQHILIGRVEHQPFQCGMDELEPMYAYVYMYVYLYKCMDLDIDTDMYCIVTYRIVLRCFVVFCIVLRCIVV